MSAASGTRSIAARTRYIRLFHAIGDAALGQIVGRHLDLDLIAGQDADVVLAHTARDVRGHDMTVLELHAEHGVRQGVEHRTVHFYLIVFCHIGSAVKNGRLGSPRSRMNALWFGGGGGAFPPGRAILPRSARRGKQNRRSDEGARGEFADPVRPRMRETGLFGLYFDQMSELNPRYFHGAQGNQVFGTHLGIEQRK